MHDEKTLKKIEESMWKSRFYCSTEVLEMYQWKPMSILKIERLFREDNKPFYGNFSNNRSKDGLYSTK